MTATTTTDPKAKAAKRDPSLCHWGAGSYGSPATSKRCTGKRPADHPGRQLCERHEALWKVEAKRRAAARKDATPAAARPATTKPATKVTPLPARRHAPRPAGQVQRVAAFVALTPTVTQVE